MTDSGPVPVRCSLLEPLLSWYAAGARDLPWRAPGVSAWGVLVSEVMLQQTPVSRVEPVWREWVARWPAPADLAAVASGEAVRAWGRLGYPRRALRLHETATRITSRYAGRIPTSLPELRGLPGVGGYTAAAVASFGFNERAAVVDTNIRRVQARAVTGAAQAAPALTRAEQRLAEDLLPPDGATASRWNVACMELGALVCTARSPGCGRCPVADRCAWLAAGRPAYAGPVKRAQPWAGTDRQARGALLGMLRAAPGPVAAEALAAAWPEDGTQRARCLEWLVTDGLAERTSGGRYQLPAT